MGSVLKTEALLGGIEGVLPMHRGPERLVP